MLFVSFGFSQNNPKADSLASQLYKYDGDSKIVVLNSITKLYALNNPRKAIEYENQINELLLSSRNDTLRALSWFNIANVRIELRDFKKAEELLHKTILINERLHNYYELGMSLSQLSYVYYRAGDLKKAHKFIIKSQTVNEKYGSEYELAIDYFRRGIYAKKLGKYKESVLYYNKAIEKFKLLKEDKMVANLLGNIGNVFENLKQYKNALKYHIQAVEIYNTINDSTGLAGSFNDIGNIYYSQDNDSLALVYFKKAYCINELINNDIWLAYNLQNIAHVKLRQKKYREAEKYALESIALKEKAKDTKSLMTSYAVLGAIFLRQQNYDSSLLYLNKSITISEKSGIRNHLISVYRDLSEVYYLKKNYKQAYKYNLLYSSEKDSVFNNEKIRIVNDIQEKYQSIESKNKILELHHDRDIQKSRETILILSIISLIIVLSLLIIGFIYKRRRDKYILHQQNLFHKKQQELSDAKLERSKLKEEELQRSNIFKSKQLSTHALHMMQKNSMLQKIQSEIKLMVNKVPDNDKLIFKNILFSISQSLRSQKDWDMFKLYFEGVNRNFYNNLNKINPDLTINDHRICALVKLNMTSKEMASVLNIAPNSIKSSRYRLKKKLRLDADADLEEFIRAL
jgi:tetratricopeptide (TPR) repeat protein